MSKPFARSYLESMRAHVDEGGQLSHRNGLDLLGEVERLHAIVDPEQANAIYSAYLGISVLRTMCKAAGLKLAEERSRDLMVELDTAFPGLAARAALRTEASKPA
ncbi:hypothetical protein [Bradyrhizobium sp. USDA 4545]|uniref:hypothetical protein n=1 Tax=Bradyrhizobium sp. USDA 4545 TaxID=2817705 RepID=UPI0020A3237F|nr:hypothetical protein [Bradyrhizobium sp. USDA 4545]MCP1832782.1 hypothetical protein [Bradyrhizobium sp. USDA 4545]